MQRDWTPPRINQDHVRRVRGAWMVLLVLATWAKTSELITGGAYGGNENENDDDDGERVGRHRIEPDGMRPDDGAGNADDDDLPAAGRAESDHAGPRHDRHDDGEQHYKDNVRPRPYLGGGAEGHSGGPADGHPGRFLRTRGRHGNYK